MPRPLERPEGLLFKARNDLALAKLGLDADTALDGVCFHAQQAAEKSVKAVLALHRVPYPFTHDLGMLIGLGAKLRADVLEFEETAENLMEYAVRARYDEKLYPDHETADEALANAQRIYDWAAGIIEGDGSEENTEAPVETPEGAVEDVDDAEPE
jgi:HEPN domain-containing protein